MAKSKFVKATKDEILQSLRRGDSLRTAAATAKVNHSQISRWLKRGEDAPAGSAYRTFYEDAKSAMAEPLIRANAIVQRDMLDNAKTAMWFLERRDPVFAPPGARQATNISTGPVLIQLSLSDGTLPALGDGDVIDGEVVDESDDISEPLTLPSA